MRTDKRQWMLGERLSEQQVSRGVGAEEWRSRNPRFRVWHTRWRESHRDFTHSQEPFPPHPLAPPARTPNPVVGTPSHQPRPTRFSHCLTTPSTAHSAQFVCVPLDHIFNLQWICSVLYPCEVTAKLWTSSRTNRWRLLSLTWRTHHMTPRVSSGATPVGRTSQVTHLHTVYSKIIQINS